MTNVSNMHVLDYSSTKVRLDNRNIKLPENPSDVDQFSEDMDVLCELVRSQYLKRLRETLISNLHDTKCCRNAPTHCQLEQCVDLCVAEMENRALRQCMVASIYRRSMSNMINEVGASTNNSMLYDLLQRVIESNNELSLREENVQPVNNENLSMLGDVNTDVNSDSTTQIRVESDNDLIGNFMVENFTTLNSVPSYETSLRYIEDHTNHEHQLPKSGEQPDNDSFGNLIFNNNEMTTDWVTDTLNELDLPALSSYILTANLSESDIFDDLNSVLKSSYNFPISTLDVSPVEADIARDSLDFSTIYNSPSFDTFLKYVQGSPEHEREFSKLEESLIHLGPDIESPDPEKSIAGLINVSVCNTNQNGAIRMNKIDEVLKNERKSARIAKAHQLKKRTSELPLALQTRLNDRYCDLFGNDHDDESDPLTDEEKQIVSHRRIVKMVLHFMNPYYQARRINKRLFKDLARLISKKLMEKSFDPDIDTVERTVSACFVGNRHIQTAEQLHLITIAMT